ncbi:MAG: flavodoxin family protein [Candidatus Caldatribacterium sp.]|uniref:flavodoxin family protein n=1 Tax=Candidatus Caldatribacterium sp. TaxID=2282143 RepID=UPI00299B5764|nr:flavodoxin family protein [Candidatus Caldatribacterium sp.]MCX7731133.1 flavodoxin family protein [Candidatus Caldatribacterium sp.]MDW8080338.1 flavodoxin family protein [Candidatus Calescibacterium sp.]
MRSLIVVVSVHHGNTRKVALALAEALGSVVREPEEVTQDEVASCDLVGFGSGIYLGRFHRRLLRFVERLPYSEGKKAFVFSTSGLGKKEYNLSLEELLKKRGFIVLGSFACRGFDTFGPLWLIGGINKGRPDTRDLADAVRFASQIKALSEEGW